VRCFNERAKVQNIFSFS